MPEVLLVAAERSELSGVLRRCTGVGRLSWPVEFSRSGVLNGVDVVAVANGPGVHLAGAAADAAFARRRPDAVVSTGCCGGLDPALVAGEIFVATGVQSETGGEVYEPLRPCTWRPYRVGLLVTADRVVCEAEEKRVLRAAGAAAVEMEAAAVAQRAAARGLPFFCVRAVADVAGEAFALDFNLYRDEAGRFRRGGIARAALARPRLAPELWRIARRQRAAARALGDFIADCRFI